MLAGRTLAIRGRSGTWRDTQAVTSLAASPAKPLRLLTKGGFWTSGNDGVSVLVDAGRRGCEPVETRKTAARPWEIDDELWARTEPLLPVVPRNPRRPGRKRLDSRRVLCGILFVLYTGISWEFLPQELGFGSGMTCWRRLRDWNEAGVWQRLHELLLSELRAADQLDFSRAAVDSSHIRAMKGGPATGPSPVDRGKTGSKHHLIVDAHGIPLAAITTGGNRNDVTQLIPLIQAVPPIRGKRGQPLRRPKHLYADRGYDHEV
ncbi:hypothetical protein SALBM311S_01148 [Streptomyces alboniger]